jgi:hypothetical protein
MTDIYKNYKLSSGDEIIGKLVGNNLDSITVNRPLCIKIFPIQDPTTGAMRDMMILRPWNTVSTELKYEIKREHIVLESNPMPEVIQIYLEQLEKEDIVSDLYADLMSDPERLEDYLKTVIEEDLEPNIQEETMEQEQPEEGENVHMNFLIPNAMFLAFLMNGIVSLDPEQEDEGNDIPQLDFNIQEFLNLKNSKGFKSKKYSKNRNVDIEKQFKNWNPEP